MLKGSKSQINSCQYTTQYSQHILYREHTSAHFNAQFQLIFWISPASQYTEVIKFIYISFISFIMYDNVQKSETTLSFI